jgi:ferredoxin-thioredoxin reductase catalytic subunit
MPKEVTFEEALDRAKRMSERYVEKGPYEFFPLPEIVDEVQRGLAKPRQPRAPVLPLNDPLRRS